MLPLIVAHRGASSLEKENRLSAFKKAIELKVDMIELDVRKSLDGVLLVHHDDFMENGGQIYHLRNISYKAISESVSHEIPTLESVLKLCAGRVALDVEIKETGYEEEALDLILRYLSPWQFVITSFHDTVIQTVGKFYPQVSTGLLLGLDKPRNLFATRLSELFPLKRYKKCRAKFLAPHYKLINPIFLKMATSNSIPLFVWTVNSPITIKRLFTQGIQAIITDVPQVALQIRQELFGGNLS
ncbi:MAG: glycerophosphodiester phosphodiesterase [Bacillota bacterium]